MLTRTQKARLGAFLLVGAVLLAGGIGLLAGLSLFRKTDQYRIRFTDSVAGLSPGASVSLRGVRIGRVEQIRIDPKDFQVVEVTVSVPRGTPITKGSLAILSGHGITGIRFIEIRSGVSRERLKPGDVIPAGKSQIDQITGKATDIAVMTERLVRNLLSATSEENRKQVEDLVRKARDFLVAGRLALEAITALVTEARPAVQRTLRNFEHSSYVLRRSMRHVDDTVVETGRQLRATLVSARGALEDARGLVGKRGRLVASLNQLDRSVSSVEKRVLAKDITAGVEQARRSLVVLQLLLLDLRMALGHVKGNVKPMVQALRNASENLEEFSRTLRENPASLLRPSKERGRR